MSPKGWSGEKKYGVTGKSSLIIIEKLFVGLATSLESSSSGLVGTEARRL